MKNKIKFLVAVVVFITVNTLMANAQEQKPFEGEILFETFEQYSDVIKKNPVSVYFDGVHKVRLILKGNKMHLIDETTKCHILVMDADVVEKASQQALVREKTYIQFCDLTKSGYDFAKQPHGAYGMLTQWNLSGPNGIGGIVTWPVTEYSFKPTTTQEVIQGHNCTLYEGNINRFTGDIDYKYSVQAYVTDIPAPKSYPLALNGLQLPNIAMKWIQKLDGGHMGLGVGEQSYYIETTVTQIIPREVSDDEFTIPSGYKISTGAFAAIKYYAGVRKQLKELGLKGKEKESKNSSEKDGKKNSKQDSKKNGKKGSKKGSKTDGKNDGKNEEETKNDVHYKTDDSWDF